MGFLMARGYTSEPTPETVLNYGNQDIVLQFLVIAGQCIYSFFIAKEISAKQDLKSHNIPTVQ